MRLGCLRLFPWSVDNLKAQNPRLCRRLMSSEVSWGWTMWVSMWVSPWQKCRLSCTPWTLSEPHQTESRTLASLGMWETSAGLFRKNLHLQVLLLCSDMMTPSPRSPPEDAAESGRPLNARWSLEQLHHRDTETVHPGAFGMAMTCISVGENDLVITARPCKLVGRKGLKKQSKPDPGNNYITKRYK